MFPESQDFNIGSDGIIELKWIDSRSEDKQEQTETFDDAQEAIEWMEKYLLHAVEEKEDVTQYYGELKVCKQIKGVI